MLVRNVHILNNPSARDEMRARAEQVSDNHCESNLHFRVKIEESGICSKMMNKRDFAHLETRNTLLSFNQLQDDASAQPELTIESLKRPIIASLRNQLQGILKLRLTDANNKAEVDDLVEDLDELAALQKKHQNKGNSNKFRSSEAQQAASISGHHEDKRRQALSLDEQDQVQMDNGNLQRIAHEFNIDTDILDYCIAEKSYNMAFQTFILQCDESTLRLIVSKVNEQLFTIIGDVYGNYLVQKLMVRSKPFLVHIQAICQKHFAHLAQNEYSSRVLQALVQMRPSFRAFVYEFFKNNMIFGVSKISVTFTLLTAMKCSESSQEFYFIEKLLESNMKLLECKLFKRVLIGYIQFADDSATLDRIWKLLSGVSFFQAKFGALILLMLVKRGHQKAMRMICEDVTTSLPSLLSKRYFKLVAEKLLHPKYFPIQSLISTALKQISFETLEEIRCSSKANFYFVVYLIISSYSKESDKEPLKRFIQQLENRFGRLLQQL